MLVLLFYSCVFGTSCLCIVDDDLSFYFAEQLRPVALDRVEILLLYSKSGQLLVRVLLLCKASEVVEYDLCTDCPLFRGKVEDVMEELRVIELLRVLVVENKLAVVLREALEILKHLHSKRSQLRFIDLPTSIPLLGLKERVETLLTDAVDPIKHLVVSVASEALKEVEGLRAEQKRSVVASNGKVLWKALLAHEEAAVFESA